MVQTFQGNMTPLWRISIENLIAGVDSTEFRDYIHININDVPYIGWRGTPLTFLPFSVLALATLNMVHGILLNVHVALKSSLCMFAYTVKCKTIKFSLNLIILHVCFKFSSLTRLVPTQISYQLPYLSLSCSQPIYKHQSKLIININY